MSLVRILLLYCAAWYIESVEISVYTGKENDDNRTILESCIITIYYDEFLHLINTNSNNYEK